jgi:hypothetical protein
MHRLLPVIRDEGRHYRKFQRVHARPAVEGEVVISVTDAGEETRNTAARGDMVVRNLTEAQEEYLVDPKKFADLYCEVAAVDKSWKLFDPIGEIRAIEISRNVTSLLGVGEEFFLMAPWGTEQVAMEGDFLVAPLPDLDEVYRIARSEFDQTYRLTA